MKPVEVPPSRWWECPTGFFGTYLLLLALFWVRQLFTFGTVLWWFPWG